MIEACERAKKQLYRLRTALVKGGFSTKADAPVWDIVTAFRTAASGAGDSSIAFMIVRDLALHINNELDDPETAFRLIDGMLAVSGARAPVELAEKLQEERSVLHRNWKMSVSFSAG